MLQIYYTQAEAYNRTQANRNINNSSTSTTTDHAHQHSQKESLDSHSPSSVSSDNKLSHNATQKENDNHAQAKISKYFQSPSKTTPLPSFPSSLSADMPTTTSAPSVIQGAKQTVVRQYPLEVDGSLIPRWLVVEKKACLSCLLLSN
jgi:hypothetical protein